MYYKAGSKYVLKLFDWDDSAYMDFVRLVRKHPNIHFPKFFGNFIKVTDQYYAVRMELLDELPFDRYDEIYHIGAYLYHYNRNQNHPDFIAATQYLDKLPELHEACDILAKNLLGTYNEDVKPSNVMVRGSAIVITDPVVVR